jgi:short-subunit dehydrogenase
MYLVRPELYLCLMLVGIGRAIAKKLVECGAETIALSRTQADLDSLKAEVTNSATVYIT